MFFFDDFVETILTFFFLILALQVLNSDDDLHMTLPPMSAAEKLDKMDADSKAKKIQREFGSRASLGSRASIRSTSSSTDSVVAAKKGL